MGMVSTTQEAPVTTRRSRSARKIQDNITIITFLLPTLILFCVFVVYPIIRSIYYSMYEWNGLGPLTDFVALDNYKRILSDKIFQKSMINGVMIVALSLFVQLPLSLLLAILVGKDLPGRGLFRTIFFMPYVFSEVIIGIMWLGIYNPDPTRGLLNALLVLIPGMKPQAWLGDVDLVLPALFVVLTWKYFGFHMLLFMAGLQNIPVELEEAARIDGVNRSQMVWYITLPLLSSTIRTSIQMSVIGSLQVFALIWIMTKGGPVNASEVMSTYMYRFSFVRFWFGYGSAIAIVMLLLSLVFSITYNRFVRQVDYLGIS